MIQENSNSSIEFCESNNNLNYFDYEEYPFDATSIDFAIKTTSERTQKWFDKGLCQYYNFNHEETIYCCDKALESDTQCAMAYFLKSLALGINYNNYPEYLDPLQAKLQYDNCQLAIISMKYMQNSTILEQKLILALKERVGDGVTLTHADCDWKYMEKMKEIFMEFPENEYVHGLYIESMMNLSPWNFWVQTPNNQQKYGEPCFEKTLEIQEVLQLAIKKFPNNLGLRHFWVHFMESSMMPELASESCFEKSIVEIAKDYSHLLHTPSHVDLVLGNYSQAIYLNELAVEASNKYFKWRESVNKPLICFNTYYRVHASHFIAYSAMLCGNYQKAVNSAIDMIKVLPFCELEDTKCFKPSGAHWCESYLPTLLHVFIRFGKWEQIISKEPFGLDVLPINEVLKNPQIYAATNCTLVYARGIAYAVLAGTAKTEEKKQYCLQQSFECLEKLIELVDRIPPTWKLLKNRFIDIMKVGIEMLQGEYYYRVEQYERAFNHLKQSVEEHDRLNYDEP